MKTLVACTLALAGLLAVANPPAALAGTRSEQPAEEAPLFVEWGGSFWPARVHEKVGGGRVQIHYEGFGHEWDETVGPARLRRESAQGDLFVEWRGSYWRASIHRWERGGPVVHYEGFGHEWDEVAAPSRLRRLSP